MSARPSGPPSGADRTVVRRDPRLVPFSLVGSAAVVAAVALGRPEAAAVAPVFLLAAVLGVRGGAPAAPEVAVAVERGEALEGDELTVTVSVDRPEVAELEVVFEPGPGVAVVEPDRGTWHLPPGRGPVALAGRVVVTSWGRHRVGRVQVRARRPAGLLVTEPAPVEGPEVRVLPARETVRALLDPPAARGAAGAHLQPRAGDGTEFAELRPFHQGDRLTHLNWRATARTGVLHRNRFHPERSGDVVCLLDTWDDGDHAAGREALARCARAAWAVARLHLSANDRVGLAAHGRVRAWLAPGGGDRARYQLLTTLLDVGTEVAGRRHGTRSDPLRWVPSTALVLAVTPLWSTSVVGDLVRLRSSGRTVVAVAVAVDDLVAPPAGEVEELARALWRAERAGRRRTLEAAGIPVVAWDGEAAIGRVLHAARRAARQPVGVLR